MSGTISAEHLLERRQELQAIIARETEWSKIKYSQAAEHAANAAAYTARLDELNRYLDRIASLRDSNDAPINPERQRGKRGYRPYHFPGITTDVVRLVYTAPGIAIDDVLTSVLRIGKIEAAMLQRS